MKIFLITYIICTIIALFIIWRTGHINPQCFVDKANEAINIRDYNKALFYINKAIILKPRSSELYIYRASLYGMLKKPESGSKDIDKAISLNPTSTKAWSTKCCINYDKGDFKTSQNAYLEVCSLIEESENKTELESVSVDLMKVYVVNSLITLDSLIKGQKVSNLEKISSELNKALKIAYFQGDTTFSTQAKELLLIFEQYQKKGD